MAKQPPQTILFLNDLHAASYAGLWPEDRIPDHKARKYVGARYLIKCWRDLPSRLPKKIDLIVLVGDLIDGHQPKSKMTGLFTADYNEQVDGATDLLKPICKRAANIIRVDGTPYHEGFYNALASLDKELGVTRKEQVIDLRLPGGILNIAHHPMGGAALYKGTTTDREVLWAHIASSLNKVHKPRWIVRAHTHTWAQWDVEQMRMILLPCWQLATPYAIKQAYWRWQPSLGACLMYADERGPGGYSFQHIDYENPKREVLEWQNL